MSRKYLHNIGLILFLFFILSCASKKNLSTTIVAVTTQETQLIDSILQYGLDHEALYTLLSDIKPMSSLITFYYPIANDDSLKKTSAHILERSKHGAYLDKLYSVQQALNRLNFPDLEFVMIPYQRAQGNKRVIQLSVLRISVLDSLLKARESFFGQFGLVPGTHPVVVTTTIENADIYERYRGYGYLFGYPDYAVDFFTEASYQANVAKQFQPRKFFQIPVHARKDGYFVYAYPENHTPAADVDSAIYYKARNVLENYEKIREKYMDADGTIRAYQLLLDHYKQ